MLEALRSLKCENIEIKLNGEVKPIIIKSVEDDNLIQLVLPIKTLTCFVKRHLNKKKASKKGFPLSKVSKLPS